jgi:hypothetical protein
MTSKLALTQAIAWGPDYDYLYEFDTHYSIYTSSSYFPGTILVNKDNINSFSDSINPNSVVFPSEEEVSTISTNAAINHSINLSRNNNNILGGVMSYPMSAIYTTTVAQVTNNAVTKATTKKVPVPFKDIPQEHLTTFSWFLKFVENPNDTGRKQIFEADGKPAYEKDKNGNFILKVPPAGITQSTGGAPSKILKFRFFDYPSKEGGLNTIGFGHKLTTTEASTGIITIDGKSIKFKKDGLSIEESQNLLLKDLSVKTTNLKNFVGAARWNYLVDKHPSWLIILNDIQFNNNVRNFPRLLYYMRLFDSPKPPEAGGDATTWNNWVNNVYSNGVDNLIFLPPKTEFSKGSFAYYQQLSNISTQSERTLGKYKLGRNIILKDAFIYFNNENGTDVNAYLLEQSGFNISR